MKVCCQLQLEVGASEEGIVVDRGDLERETCFLTKY